MAIPTENTFDEIVLNLSIAINDMPATTESMYFYDLLLFPLDEWSGSMLNPISLPSDIGDQFPFFVLDSLSQPKTGAFSFIGDAYESATTTLIASESSRVAVPPRREVAFAVETEQVNHDLTNQSSHPHNVFSVSIRAAMKYLTGIGGDND